MMEEWTPKGEGSGFEFTPTLKPIEAFRDRLVILSGLDNDRVHGGDHTGAPTKFLTAVPPETGRRAGRGVVSMDQFSRSSIGQETQLASLEMSLRNPTKRLAAAPATATAACAPARSPGAMRQTPLPWSPIPARSSSGCLATTRRPTRRARLARCARNRSILDSVTEKLATGCSTTSARSDRASSHSTRKRFATSNGASSAWSRGHRELPPTRSAGWRAGVVRGARRA